LLFTLFTEGTFRALEVETERTFHFAFCFATLLFALALFRGFALNFCMSFLEEVDGPWKNLVENFGASQSLGGLENCCGKLRRLTKFGRT
jgi:hypothetical protein